jgi:AraC family transcriptional activator of mtrCDE
MNKGVEHRDEGPLLRTSGPDLDRLLSALEVEFVRLSECLVSRGWRLSLGGPDVPGLHYTVAGAGRLTIPGRTPIPLHAHTLVVLPAGQQFSIDALPTTPAAHVPTVNGREQEFPPGALRRYVAGDGEPDLILICGYFRATYGVGIDLFSRLASPIVEQFDVADHVDDRLRSALAELIAQEVGMGSMTTTLLKQVLVTLLRRSLRSTGLWVERFALWSDPQIARAFVEMVTRPGAPHRVETLAQIAGLSRSAFMARFADVFARSPMAVLRSLRMRRAAGLLVTDKGSSIDQAAAQAGYSSRSSFCRAFRSVYGCDPTEYRAAADTAQSRAIGVVAKSK